MSFIGYFGISVLIFIFDQCVKWMVVTHIKLNTTVSFIPHCLSLSNVRNTGAAWSMFQGQQGMFVLISVIALIILICMLKNNTNDKLFSWGVSLMLGGTLGNFFDRLRLGYVVDMFTTDFMNFPIFNVADCALTIGVLLLLISLFKGEDDGKISN